MRNYIQWVTLALVFAAATSVYGQGRSDEARGREISRNRRSDEQQALDSRRQLVERIRAENANRTIIPGLERRNDLEVLRSGIGPQTGTGRLREAHWQRRDEVHSRLDTLRPDHTRLRDRSTGQARIANHRQPFANRKSTSETAAPTERPGMRMSEIVSHGRNRLAYIHADRLLSKRLAQIDRLRDRALSEDDEELLDQADHLESLARRQYQRRVIGREPSEPETENVPPMPPEPPTDEPHDHMPETAPMDGGVSPIAPE